jgi:hypothetical protein
LGQERTAAEALNDAQRLSIRAALNGRLLG